MILILGGFSLLTLFFQYKKSQLARYGLFIVLLLSITSLVTSKYVGVSGGEITHIEIRNESDVIKIDTEKDQDDYQDYDRI